MTWLAHAGPSVSGADAPAAGGTVLAGPGTGPVRGARRINGVLTAVRAMVVHAVAAGAGGGHLGVGLYEGVEDRGPAGAGRGGGRGEAGGEGGPAAAAGAGTARGPGR